MVSVSRVAPAAKDGPSLPRDLSASAALLEMLSPGDDKPFSACYEGRAAVIAGFSTGRVWVACPMSLAERRALRWCSGFLEALPMFAALGPGVHYR